MSSSVKDFRNVPCHRNGFLHECPYIFFDLFQVSATALRAKQDRGLHPPLIQVLAAVLASSSYLSSSPEFKFPQTYSF